MALVAGVQAPTDKIMGHAGAIWIPSESDARTKARRLQEAGVVITNHPSKFGETMQILLENEGKGNTEVERPADSYFLADHL